jgi:hypothetical protein
MSVMLTRLTVLFLTALVLLAQRNPPREPPAIFVLKPARVFDGDTTRTGLMVRVRGERIEAVGASVDETGAKSCRPPRRDADAGIGRRPLALFFCIPTTRRPGTIRSPTKAWRCASRAP